MQLNCLCYRWRVQLYDLQSNNLLYWAYGQGNLVWCDFLLLYQNYLIDLEFYRDNQD